MRILKKDSIIDIVKDLDLIPKIKDGFIAYSEGRSVVPPVGELSFDNPPGDVHIKYGYITNDKYFVIKIASGFYENEKLGLPNGSGLMLIFDQKTGKNLAILADDAYLTDLRTALAGAICAELLSNPVKCIGVIGTGLQARMQIQYLKLVTDCRKVIAWGRNEQKMNKYKKDITSFGFSVECANTTGDVAKNCNIIITTTAAKDPLLHTKDILSGTHITAIGSDTPQKQELEAGILAKANLVVTDSISQCIQRGEISHGLRKSIIQKSDIVELGNVLSGNDKGRNTKEDITVADLTGVAVQDIQIATAVYETSLEYQS